MPRHAPRSRGPVTHDHSVAHEALFEQAHIAAQESIYRSTDVEMRYRTDPAYRKKISTVEAFLGKGGEGLILDLGSNTGGESTLLGLRGYQLVAGDVNPLAVGIAYERARRADSDVRVLVLDAHRLPFRDHAFESVVCWEVLHHFSRLDDVLTELYRVMRPGGRLLAYEPCSGNPYRRFSEWRHTWRTHGHGIEKSFSPKGLEDALVASGFVVTRMTRGSVGLSTWKAERYPTLKRLAARMYYRLVDLMPGWLAPIIVEFERPG